MKKKSPVNITEEEMTVLNTLNERDRRHFIACKVTGPYGCAIKHLCAFWGVSTKTVVKGIRELREKTCLESDRIRKPGGGTPLISVADACNRAAKTVTKTGLKVFSRVVNKVYETGRKISDGYREELARRIIFDTELHNWNYLINHA